MIMDIVFVAGGLCLLFLGGEALVRGSVAIAERLGVSKLLIGLVIVGFGTSTPELLVSVKAAIGGAPEIALGNVIGSNIANVLLVIGLASLIAPIVGWQRAAVREALVAVLVSLTAFALVQGAVLSRNEGIAMLAVLAGYLISSYWFARRDRSSNMFQKEAEEFTYVSTSLPWLPPLLTISGIVSLVFGADFLVNGAVNIARSIDVPDSVIGLSLVAVGTSLPELATAVVAAIKRQSEVVLGNVIGSNIFNILAILGVTVVIHPIEINDRFRLVDSPVMLAATLALLTLLFATKKIGALAGISMLISYALYMFFLF